MSRELVVSSTPHETRLAILDDDQLVEIYIERESDQGLAGSIHKGRVTRVLPGMQSAFVDIGLERDAFLYVSDFLDTSSEFEEGEDVVEANNRKPGRTPKAAGQPADPAEAVVKEAGADPAAAESGPGRDEGRDGRERGGRERGGGRRRRSRRGRRRGGRERTEQQARDGQTALPKSKYASLPGDELDANAEPETARKIREEPVARPSRNEEPQADPEFELLPGESLAKYGSAAPHRTDAEVQEAETDSSSRTSEVESSNAPEPQPLAATLEQQQDGPADSAGTALIDEEEPDQDDAAAWDEDDDSEDDEDSDDNGRDDDEDEDDDSEEEDDDDDDEDEEEEESKGIDFSEHLAAAERIAALIEEQEGDDVPEDGEETDSDGDEDEESATPQDDEQKQEISEFRSDSDDDDEDDQDDYEPSFVDETEDRRGGDSDEKSGIPGQPLDQEPRNRQRRDGQQGDGDEQDVAAAAQSGDDDHTSTVPGQPETAQVRGDRSGSRNLQRRGRRGRRRGGRSRDRQPREERAQTPLPKQAVAERSERSQRVESSEGSSGSKITDMLQKGNEILVQIAKEPLGKKGARITSHIALPGRYLVYMPTVDHVGVSRKIASFEERKRLRNVVRTYRTGMPGGFIVRTAGGGTPEEEIRGDMLFLYNLWLDIRQKSEERRNPGLVHQDLDIVERTLRDQLDEDFKAIWVDAEDEYERILRFVERFQPSLLSRVKLYTRRRPIFDEFNISAALEKAMRPKVWLKSGGYIVINQTEALVAVDVNTGKYVGKSDRLEDTIVNTNVEAAKEVVRQIRLRDLGGIIVVDFIDMDDRKNRQKVLQVLEQAMQADPAPSKSLSFNDFGLVAITRKRVKQSLERTLCSSCPTCNGSGHLKSETTVILEILQEAHKIAPGMDPQKDITLRVNPEIGRLLKSRKNNYLQEIETILRSHIVVRSDLSLHRERFDIN